MKQKHLFPFIIFVGLHTLLSAQSRLESYLRDSLDVQVERGMTQWDIPAVAVAVVQGDKVIWSKGYGVCDKETKAPVNENTLFMIGSNTKAFTGTAMAMLEADKTWSLNDNVQKWLPGFTMKDPWVASHLNLTDILCHRIGMETFQGDFTYWTSNLSTKEVIEKFGKFTPVYGFRTKWGYTNAGFAIAGECINAASGKSWADFLHQRIFTPLEMTRTLALSSTASKASNMAQPYSRVEGKTTRIPFANIDNLAPAGSIASSANDLSHWLIAQLNNGQYNGKEVIPPAVIRRTRKPESILGRSRSEGEHYQLYGLGWVLMDFHGKELVKHTGGVNGYVTAVTLIPEEKTGIVVLTNTDSNGFFESLNQTLVDAACGLPYTDQNGAALQGYTEYLAGEDELLKKQRDTVAMHLAPSLNLKQYCGKYTNEMYGFVNIEKDGPALKMTFEHHACTAKLESLGNDRFLCSFSDPIMGKKAIPFHISGGKVSGFTLILAAFVEMTTYEFIKQ